MKTLEELAAIRNKMKGDVTLRNEGDDKIRIVVGMATCGIAAGARPVMKTLMEEIEKRQIKNAYVTQTGCIGLCKLEPIVEVYMDNGEKLHTLKLTAKKQ
ncbi:MAG: (2Fe-2S) ferredoxin domain-containing protein [Clostridiales bacterium]|nr:MAG: (2Fe-2S) ferredoxin domain-containing protein [Clostridiales bacterium]